MKTLVIVQARTGSTRLPGKVLMQVAGKTLLEHQLRRIRTASTPLELVIATTRQAEDDPIEELCRRLDVKCFRGHSNDLLDRHFEAARMYKAETVVKIPSDCPLIDPAVIDHVLSHYHLHSTDYDYCSNLHPATYPDGNDVEVIPFTVLELAWQESILPFEREHTTPYIWDQPDLFRITNVAWPTGLDYSMSHRWTLDYPEDFRFIEAIYNELWSETKIFTLEDILELLTRKPELAEMNQRYAGVNWYRLHTAELRTITSNQTRII
ncbi:MAG: acylneuraminate cytidylyltransferase [Acidobacteria bacterium]|nr:MAG: acylneuraminate cytidylyltransferase [Acidobacteriota bacterium]